jgi:hypothetical protein
MKIKNNFKLNPKPMKQVLDLLKEIDDAEETEIAGFDTCEEAVAQLTDILNIHLKSKS